MLINTHQFCEREHMNIVTGIVREVGKRVILLVVAVVLAVLAYWMLRFTFIRTMTHNGKLIMPTVPKATVGQPGTHA